MVIASSIDVVLYYFLSIISTNFNVIVDNVIRTSGHGKDVVDGIYSCNNRYLLRKMNVICIPEADNSKSRINANSMVGSTSFSLAKECKRLRKDEKRINDMKSHSKFKKREGNSKVKKSLSLTR